MMSKASGEHSLRILMVAPTPYFADRGCHVRIYDEAKALKARGHQVVIVSYHLGRDIGDIPVVRIPKIPWYRKLSAGPSWHKPFLDVLLLCKVVHTAWCFRPDVVHAHLHEGAFVSALAKPFIAAPMLFDCQGSLSGELLDHEFISKGGLLHRLFQYLESWITRRADYIVTSSSPTADFVSALFPEVSGHLKPLPDAVDTEMFRPMSKDLRLMEELGLPASKKIIVYLGAMTEYQGVGVMCNALAQVCTQRDDFHVLMMGYPFAEYEQRAIELGLVDHITFTGRLDFSLAPQYLGLGDLAISVKVSATEANGKLHNYMACGLPVIATETPVNREILGELGFYVPIGDVSALAKTVAECLDSPVRMRERGKMLRALSVQKHSWSSRGQQLEAIMMQLLENA
jgi:glycosyltransferase involved in cell wall biosynthesis